MMSINRPLALKPRSPLALRSQGEVQRPRCDLRFCINRSIRLSSAGRQRGGGRHHEAVAPAGPPQGPGPRPLPLPLPLLLLRPHRFLLRRHAAHGRAPAETPHGARPAHGLLPQRSRPPPAAGWSQWVWWRAAGSRTFQTGPDRSTTCPPPDRPGPAPTGPPGCPGRGGGGQRVPGH